MHLRALPLAFSLLSSAVLAQSAGAGAAAPADAGAAGSAAGAVTAAPAPARDDVDEDDPLSDRRVTFGAAIAPAALPAGSMAAYAFLGVPELGLGVRQGFGPFELEGRAKIDYLKLSGALDLLGRFRVYKAHKLLVAPFAGVGVLYNTGVTYADADNFDYFAARVLGGAVASYGLSETIRAIGVLEVPVDIGLAPAGAFRVTPLIGAGAEFYVGEDYTVAVLGQIGFDVRKDPVALTAVGLGYGLRIALGYRLF